MQTGVIMVWRCLGGAARAVDSQLLVTSDPLVNSYTLLVSSKPLVISYAICVTSDPLIASYYTM